jgi:nitrogen regulatory protein PII
MKLIKAIIKPFKLEEVRDALIEHGANGATVSEVRGFGRQMGHGELYRGVEYAASFIPKLAVEVCVTDDRLHEVMAAICKAAFTGRIGDGKLFVTNVEQAVRIRTGESQDAAIT